MAKGSSGSPRKPLPSQPGPDTGPASIRPVHFAFAAVGLLLIFALLAWTASRSKSPTYDEPLSALSAWTSLRLHDYRLDYEHPPLWKFWATLPNGRHALSVNLDDPNWKGLLEYSGPKWDWTHQTLYGTSGNDAHRLIARSQAMMLVVALVLAGLLTWWGWRLWGTIGAITALTLFAFDPNFLAHSALVKNDVAMALATLAVAHAAWLTGRRATVGRVVYLGIVTATALVVKLSAMLLLPIVALILLTRALLPEPWTVLRWTLPRFRAKLLAAAAIGLWIALASYTLIWAVYGFRFDPTPIPNNPINLDRIVRATAEQILSAKNMRFPTEQEVAAWKPDAFTRTVLWMNRHRVLPQAYLAAMQYTRHTAAGSWGYLLGEIRYTGWWYYFPLAMLFKTPTATLLAIAVALCLGLAIIWRRRIWREDQRRWDLICLLVPLGLYAASAIVSNNDMGIRYILPLYPLLYLLIAGVARWSWQRARKPAQIILLILAAGLILETLAGYPDYLAFFNLPSGGSRGGLSLLGDSNLDWGQDLPALADWQRQHPEPTLYLSYSGTADPAAYGIRYINLPGGYPYGPPPQSPRQPGVIAISATNLQGIFFSPDDPYASLRQLTPIDVLHGTIYLYTFPAR